MTKKKKKTFLVNIALFFVVLCLMLILCELLLGTLLPQKVTTHLITKGSSSSFDPLLGWTDYRNSTKRIVCSDYDITFATNSLGVADMEWPLNKKEGEKRVVFLGDSFTKGMGVKKHENFVALVGEKISDEGYTTMNFGVEGYSTCQEYIMAVNFSLRYDPDIVVLVFFIGNDFEDNLDNKSGARPICYFKGSELKYTSPTEPLRSVEGSFLNTIFEKTNLGVLAMNAFRYSPVSSFVAGKLGIGQNYGATELFLIKNSEKNKAKIEYAADILSALDRKLSHEGVQFKVLLLPDMIQIQNDTWKKIISKYRYNITDFDLLLPNKELTKLLDEKNISYVDLYYPLKEELIKNRGRLYFENDKHLTNAGHFAVGNIIYDILKEKE